MRGHLRRRGRNSWLLKFDAIRDATGKRTTRYVTIRGTRRTAEGELARLLKDLHEGVSIEPSRITVADCLRTWLEGPHGLSPKTHERYLQLSTDQVGRYLGNIPIQKLRPAEIQKWHATLMTEGGKGDKPLSARTVGHAHAVLRTALQRALDGELLSRNPAELRFAAKGRGQRNTKSHQRTDENGTRSAARALAVAHC